jgi:hypothetical protein
MGTRGCYGFRKNGIDKLTYNHYDSYPSGLGSDVVKFCKETSLKEMSQIFDRIMLVDQSSVPDFDQIAECKKYCDLSVSSCSEKDWYCLLRGAQGDLNVYKNGLRYMLDDCGFIKDSLFCEYAYIINLDTKRLEFYVGFQRVPDETNRYGTEDDRGYYPCKMVSTYSLNTKRSIEQIVKMMENKCK